MFTIRTKLFVGALLSLAACANWGGCPAQFEPDPFDFVPIAGGDPALELDPAFIDARAKLDQPGGADALWQAGGGLIGRRMEMFELLPDANGLFPINDAEKNALLDRFRGTVTDTDDLLLCVYAELLELYGDPSVIPALVDFLIANVTGVTPDAVNFVTHTVRTLAGLPVGGSVYYRISEIEETIALRGPGGTQKALRAKAQRDSCYREFYLLGADGNRLKDANGNEVRIGGTVYHPRFDDIYAGRQTSRDTLKEIIQQGGTSVDFVDSESGYTFQGVPTIRFNCAGFAFRQFIGGRPWSSDPDAMLNALNAAGLLERIYLDTTTQPGDFAFYFRAGGTAGHVAVIQEGGSPISSPILINDDGLSGMFTAPANAAWFNKYKGGVGYYRWKNGGPPGVEAVTDRTVANSCFGEDTDNDGFPESETCASATNCVDAAVGGVAPAPRFKIWRVTNWYTNGYIRVMPENADQDPPLLSSFPGGGLDPNLRAILAPVAGTDVYPTVEAAVDDVCHRVCCWFRHPLASFILEADFDGVRCGIDLIFQQRCGQ